MTAPDSDPRKQAWQHRGPLMGVALAAFAGAFLLIWWLFDEPSQTPTPVEDQTAAPADPQSAAPAPDAPPPEPAAPVPTPQPAPPTAAPPATTPPATTP